MSSIARRPLGKTEIQVTEIGFGGAAVGNLYTEISDTEARATLNAATEAGIHLFDTAPHYGFGLSERRIGDALRGREDYVLSTKVGRILRPIPQADAREMRLGFRSPMPFEPTFDYTRDGILRSVEHSLQRLGLARFDIALVHDIGRLTHGAAHETHFEALTNGGGFAALSELKAAGLVSAIGLGVNECEVCLEAMGHVDLDVVLLAGRYTLLEQGALDRFLPSAHENGLGVILGGIYNSGVLAGANTYNYETADAAIMTRVASLSDICTKHDVPLAAAALHFALAHPAVSSVIPGLGSPDLVAETMRLYRMSPPRELWVALKAAELLRDDAPTP